MTKCGHCGQTIKAPAKKKVTKWGEPYPDSLNPGLWLQDKFGVPKSTGTLSVPAKTRNLWDAQRARKSRENNTEWRNARLNALGIFYPHPIFKAVYEREV